MNLLKNMCKMHGIYTNYLETNITIPLLEDSANESQRLSNCSPVNMLFCQSKVLLPRHQIS